MTRLDPRLLDARHSIGVATLLAVFTAHCRGIPAAGTCPGCGHLFSPDDWSGDCPSNSVVRPLLTRHIRINPRLLNTLSAAQQAELAIKPTRTPRPARPTPATAELFNPHTLRRRPRD
jgi:hypothetical protein